MNYFEIFLTSGHDTDFNDRIRRFLVLLCKFDKILVVGNFIEREKKLYRKI